MALRHHMHYNIPTQLTINRFRKTDQNANFTIGVNVFTKRTIGLSNLDSTWN